ncbi:helix-hairpin-helix motif protein [Klosneuvirus KNV1]|uniref:Helix-hairpin-helix motif protein n=1 Tax=Klosneuvirus KNV1 TaxID=1977640 RepID=A0A1V0SLR9_9VIRU|nr:helix-hairpin-helix motif protein [Klosneuvirus KNV1]
MKSSTIILPQELKAIFEKNTRLTKNKIMRILNTCININSYTSRGWIYGFMHKNDINTETNFKIKIGKTSLENPYTRIMSQQNGIPKFVFKTNKYHDCERLIHLFFRFAKYITYRGREWFNFTEKINIEYYIQLIINMINSNLNCTNINSFNKNQSNYHMISPININNIKINVNTISKPILKHMPLQLRIRQRIDRIIEYREENGPYNFVGEIIKVHGIKASQYKRLEKYLTI